MNLTFSALKIPASGTLGITVGDKGLGTLGKKLNKMTGGALERAMKNSGFKAVSKSSLTVLEPSGTKLGKIILIGMGRSSAVKSHDLELLGGKFAAACEKDKTATVLFETPEGYALKSDEAAARFALGVLLRSYRFNKYKTVKKNAPVLNKVTVGVSNPTSVKKAYTPLKALAAGMMTARDLVNEPANVLHPTEFAKRAKNLTKLGVTVEVLTEAQMKRLGMGALLGVGQGSVQPSKMVVMQWKGAAKTKKPVAFVGKGVCFDTGGISIKPSAGMEDMRGDMGGAAAVTGLMEALARRKAKANVVGVIGLVENMPSGDAQRPGDIVTSMSGQTIEVLNTDAEGRLVLADALWYTQQRFKPQFMIDLATLTGAILVALGQEYAGLFTNNDKIAERLKQAGEAEDEKVWRMPLHEKFDKMIDTPNADMKNIGGRYAGSTTAAQFLQRFTNKVPWAHLDIAGTAMGSPKTPTSQSWASGYGVKLLNRFVQDFYEG